MDESADASGLPKYEPPEDQAVRENPKKISMWCICFIREAFLCNNAFGSVNRFCNPNWFFLFDAERQGWSKATGSPSKGRCNQEEEVNAQRFEMLAMISNQSFE
jgi:hypothetical protein